MESDRQSSIDILFLSGLLKKPFIPELRHSCFVDSWQSALRATTTRILADVHNTVVESGSSLGKSTDTLRFPSRTRSRLQASTPSHIGMSRRIRRHMRKSSEDPTMLTMVEQRDAEIPGLVALPFCDGFLPIGSGNHVEVVPFQLLHKKLLGDRIV